jgi:hypothetical protein
VQAHLASTHSLSIPSSPTLYTISEKGASGRFDEFAKNPLPPERMQNPIVMRTVLTELLHNDVSASTPETSHIAKLLADEERMVTFVQQLLKYVVL